MKRWLFCLVPWMAMTAAAQQEAPREAEVIYTNVGPADAWRVGDEGYILPSVLTAWHWPFKIENDVATIEAEGRTLKVPTSVVHGRTLVPVRAVFDQLGGACKWRTDSELDVTGEIRLVTLADGQLTIDSTLSSKPRVFSLNDPPRLVIDFRGMTMAQSATNSLPDSVHVAQYSADTVRVVYQSPNVPAMGTDFSSASRHFVYRLDFKEAPPSTGSSTQGIVTHDPDPGSEPGVKTPSGPVGTVSITRTSGHGLDLAVSLPAPLASPPVLHRIDPFTFEVSLPGAQLGEIQRPDSKSIQDLSVRPGTTGSILRVQTMQPMGVQFSTSGNTLELNMARTVGEASLLGKVVVVDAGHGGQDSGARAPDRSVDEKTVTLQIATDLANDLRSEGATVIMTRSTDVFIPLKERPAIANRNGADLFISIHINSNSIDNSKSGTTTYYHGDNPNGRLLAQYVEHEIVGEKQLPGLGVLSDTSRYKSGFAVLRYSRMPAILIETAFINNSVDRAKMITDSFQKTVASAVVRGLRMFLADAKQENSN